MDLKNYVTAIPMEFLDGAFIHQPFYTPINVGFSNGLPLPCSIIRIINATDQYLFISLDGVVNHNHFWIAGGQALQINAQVNNLVPGNIAQFAKGTIFYVKNEDPLNVPVGTVYIAGYSSYRS